MDKPVAVIVPRVEELENVKQYYVTVENEELKLGKLYICSFLDHRGGTTCHLCEHKE
jgi:hypothetical protein